MEILEWLKMRLYEKNRSLVWALGILEPLLIRETETLGTDGFVLYINPVWFQEAFLEDSEALCHLFLHVLCHCMLHHPFRYRKHVWQETDWDQEAWELAEELLGDLKDPNARAFLGKDDHRLWAGKPEMISERPLASGAGALGEGQEGEKQSRRWLQAQKAARGQRTGTSRRTGSRRMSVTRSLTLTSKRRYDYRSFLKGFSSLREEGGTDMEQFDYGFYYWGLSHYGNVPLIEPLEYRESQKIEELVIVIDTSGSCSRELVQMFLEETRNILKEEELFFRRFLLHILQCDNQIQRDDRITSQEELDRYLDSLHITGGGGTDFRPAFARVEDLRRQELHRLKGVLYFTDGYGIYPEKMPDYRVAFVFLKYRYDAIDVPDWAEVLVLDAERPKGAAYEY